MEFTQEIGESRRALVRSFRRHAVHFAAIAGGKHQRFLENALGAKLFGSAPGLLGGKRHPFAHLHGRGAVVQSDENDLHADALNAPKKIGGLPKDTSSRRYNSEKQ